MLVRIITPSAVIFDKACKIVTMPGEEGVFGAMPGHVPLIASLQSGIIKVDTGEREESFFIHGGISQVNGEAVNIVTEFGLDISKVTKDEINSKLIALQERSRKAEEEVDAVILQKEIGMYERLLRFLN
jgi:F-type H+-transporting ATPase subunit epsilon